MTRHKENGHPWWSWPDRHPSVCAVGFGVAVFVGLRVYSKLHDGPVLIAGAASQQRLTIYGELASTAVALLAVTLTVLTILLALPDRPVVREIREGRYTWRLLRSLLLVTAFLALTTLVAAHVATGVDNAPQGKEWLEQIVIAGSVSTLLALLVCGGTFWMIIERLDKPADPSRGRGEGSAGAASSR
jgi:hypothetical protein